MFFKANLGTTKTSWKTEEPPNLKMNLKMRNTSICKKKGKENKVERREYTLSLF